MGHVNPNTVSSSHSLSVHPRHIAAGKLIFSKFTSSAFVARPQLCRVQPHELTKHFLLLCKSVALMKNPMFPLVLPPPISRITPFPTFSSPASICTPPPPAAALVLRACASARHFQSSSPSTACPRNNLCFYHPVSIILGLTMRLKGVTTESEKCLATPLVRLHWPQQLVQQRLFQPVLSQQSCVTTAIHRRLLASYSCYPIPSPLKAVWQAELMPKNRRRG